MQNAEQPVGAMYSLDGMGMGQPASGGGMDLLGGLGGLNLTGA